MNGTDEYCVVCGQDGPLRHEQKATEFDVRGETLHFQVPVTVCPSCGTTEVEDGLDPAEMRRLLCRVARGEAARVTAELHRGAAAMAGTRAV